MIHCPQRIDGMKFDPNPITYGHQTVQTKGTRLNPYRRYIYSDAVCYEHEFGKPHQLTTHTPAVKPFDFNACLVKVKELTTQINQDTLLSTQTIRGTRMAIEVRRPMCAEEAHFWFYIYRHGLNKQKKEWLQWLDELCAHQFTGKLPETTIRKAVTWVDSFGTRNQWSALQTTLLTLSTMFDPERVYDQFKARFEYKSLVPSLKYLPKTLSAQIREDLSVLIAQPATTYDRLTMIQTLQAHGNEHTITQFFTCGSAGRLFPFDEAYLLSKLSWENFRACVYDQNMVFYSAETLIAHVRHHGLEHLDLAFDKIDNPKLDHWHCVFKLHAPALTRLMLTWSQDDESQHQRLAQKWLLSEGANAIAELVKLVHPSMQEDAEQAKTILCTYIRRGMGDLVHQLALAHTDETNVNIVEALLEKEQPPVQPANMPTWFEYWSRRGLSKRGRKYSTLSLPPLRNKEGQLLNHAQRVGIVRMFQDHNKVRAKVDLPQLPNWLDQDSFEHLYIELILQWMETDMLPSMTWILDVCLTFSPAHFEQHIPIIHHTIAMNICSTPWEPRYKETAKQIAHILKTQKTPTATFWRWWHISKLMTLPNPYNQLTYMLDQLTQDMPTAQQLEAILVHGPTEYIVEMLDFYFERLQTNARRPRSDVWLNMIEINPKLITLRRHFLWAALDHTSPPKVMVFRLDDDGSTVDAHDNPVHFQHPQWIRPARRDDIPQQDIATWQNTLLEHECILFKDILTTPQEENK